MNSVEGKVYLATFPECWGDCQLLLRAEKSGVDMRGDGILEFTVMRDCVALDGERWRATEKVTLMLDSFSFKPAFLYMENK